jgi:hypothetical protein
MAFAVLIVKFRLGLWNGVRKDNRANSKAAFKTTEASVPGMGWTLLKIPPHPDVPGA